MTAAQRLLGIETLDLTDIKIHFATGNEVSSEALNEYFAGTFQSWQDVQTRKNFERPFILSLAQTRPNHWLFVGLFRQLGVSEVDNEFLYKTELADLGATWIGRLEIRYQKPGRQSYTFAENNLPNFEIAQIFEERLQVRPFPGFENIDISNPQLRSIVRSGDGSWKAALSSVSGVYLISDRNNGKNYVGSATGEASFWQRWSEYAETRHGGNKELVELVSKTDLDYWAKVHYSILEIFNRNTAKQHVLDRESYWKKILQTRAFGYNSN